MNTAPETSDPLYARGFAGKAAEKVEAVQERIRGRVFAGQIPDAAWVPSYSPLIPASAIALRYRTESSFTIAANADGVELRGS